MICTFLEKIKHYKLNNVGIKSNCVLFYIVYLTFSNTTLLSEQSMHGLEKQEEFIYSFSSLHVIEHKMIQIIEVEIGRRERHSGLEQWLHNTIIQ